MRKIIPLFTLATLFSCNPSEPANEIQEASLSTSEKRNIIESVMDKQEEAWNSANLEGFMEPYLKSDSLMFIGSRGLNYGWQTTLSNYIKSYPDPEAMGKLEFENLEFIDLGTEHSFMIGRWHLYRTADTLEGSYSLLWKWIETQPVIIADHSS